MYVAFVCFWGAAYSRGWSCSSVVSHVCFFVTRVSGLTKLVGLHMASVLIQSVVLLFFGAGSSIVSFCDMERIPIVVLELSLF